MNGSDIRSRLISTCATVIPNTNNELISCDLTSFIEGLILFDKQILKSIRLKEFPFLVNTFGYDGVMELLSSGIMDVHCEAFSIAQIGHTNLSYRKTKGSLPLGSYSFAHIESADYDKYIHDCKSACNNDPLWGVIGVQN